MKRLESNYMGDIVTDKVMPGETVEDYAFRQETSVEELRRLGMVKANPKNQCSTEYLLVGDSMTTRAEAFSRAYRAGDIVKSSMEQYSKKIQKTPLSEGVSRDDENSDYSYDLDAKVRPGEGVFEYIDRTAWRYEQLQEWGMIHINPANCTPYLYEGDSPSAHISKLPHRVKGRD